MSRVEEGSAALDAAVREPGDAGSVRVARPAKTAPNTKLFHEKMNARIVPTTMPGRASSNAM